MCTITALTRLLFSKVAVTVAACQNREENFNEQLWKKLFEMLFFFFFLAFKKVETVEFVICERRQDDAKTSCSCVDISFKMFLHIFFNQKFIR